MKKANRLWIGAVLAVLLVILAGAAAGAKTAYGATSAVAVNWVTEENAAGEVTSVKAKWGKVTGATGYLVNIYRNGTMISQQKVTTTTYDISDVVLSYGSGTFRIDGLVVKSGSRIEMASTSDLKLFKVTVDTGGHGEAYVINNVKDGTIFGDCFANSYIRDLTGSTAPAAYYEDGQSLIAIAAYEKSLYKSYLALLSQTYYLVDGEEQTMLQQRFPISGDVEAHAIWFDVIEEVDLTVEAPVCGTATETPKADGDWDWDAQTNGPQVTLPANEHYHLNPEDEGLPAAWWIDINDEDEPFVGTFTGGDGYGVQIDLAPDFGYVFPDGDYNGIFQVTVNGEECADWFMAPGYSYGSFNCVDDAHPYFAALHSVGAEHDWNPGTAVEPGCTVAGIQPYVCSGCSEEKTEEIPAPGHAAGPETVTKASPEADGRIVQTCTRCGEVVKTTVISRPATFTLSASAYTYDGTAKKPAVTIRDAAGKTIAAANYTVTYTANVNAGTATAKVAFKGDRYTGTRSLTYKINAASLTGAAVTGVTDKVYTGKAVTQTPVVKLGSVTLTAGTDYTVTYKNNVNAGTATVTVTGKGNYAGTVQKTFTIRKAAQALSAKAAAASIAVGKTTTITAGGAQGAVTYASSDTSIAAVSSTGVVTGKKAGKAVITVTAAATVNYNSASVKVTITVAEQKLPFDDVTKKDSCYDAVYWAYFAGIVKGKSKTLFAPDDGITRGEFCTMLWRMWGKPEVTDKDVASMPFADAKASNHKKAIAWCYGKGVIKGYDDGTFKPSRQITRTNILVMLFKLGKKEAGYKQATIANPFTDVKDDNKNIGAFKWAYQYGLTKDRKLEPTRNCTRAEMVGFIYGYNKTYQVIK